MSLQLNHTINSAILYTAMELSASKWKLCFKCRKHPSFNLYQITVFIFQTLALKVSRITALGRSRLSVKSSDNLKAINLASGFNTKNCR